MNEKPKPERSIRAGAIEFVQKPDGSIILRFQGKAGLVQVKADAGQLERWAKRQMRDGVFA